MSIRISKRDWYFKIARDVALRSPCISRRRFGAILVKNDAIIATGYAGSVRGAKNCGIDNPCLKDLYNEEPNKSYDHCCSIHAEMNCIVNAAREGTSTVGATLYLSEANDKNDRPCFLCRRFIIQAGIKDVYYYKFLVVPRIEDFQVITKYPERIIYHEEVSEWINMENKWIEDQVNNAPK